MSLGDHNGSARQGGQSFDAELDDPFEELARILEAPGPNPGRPDVGRVAPTVAAPEQAVFAAAVADGVLKRDAEVQAAEGSGTQDPAMNDRFAPSIPDQAPNRANPVQLTDDLDAFDEGAMNAALTQELSEALELAVSDMEPFPADGAGSRDRDARSSSADIASPVKVLQPAGQTGHGVPAPATPAPVAKPVAQPAAAATAQKAAPAAAAPAAGRPAAAQQPSAPKPVPAAAQPVARPAAQPAAGAAAQKASTPAGQPAVAHQPAAPKPAPAAAAPAAKPVAQPAAGPTAPKAAAPAGQPAVAQQQPVPKPAPAAAAPVVKPMAQPAAGPSAQKAAAPVAQPATAQQPAAPAAVGNAAGQPHAPKSTLPGPKAGAAAAAVAGADAARAGHQANEFDREFERALLGLSEPANPRQATFHHSEAFAPEREPSVAEDNADARIFDDFDELIASELAAIKQEAPREAAFAQAVDADGPKESPEWPSAFETPSHGAEDPDAHEFSDENEMRATRRTAAMAGRGSAARSSFVGAGIGAIALMLAAGGAYYFLGGSQGTVGDGSVLIVRADQDPVKVKPENPGGREIPNQNKMVYNRVEDGDAIITPQQKQLVSAEESPIDLPREEASISDLPGVEIGVGTANAAEPTQGEDASAKGADSYSEASAISVLSPRRAKTYSVRSDGTLVVNEAATDERGPLIQAAARPVDAAREIGTAPNDQGIANETVSAIAAAGEDAMADQGAEAAATTAADAGVAAPNVPVPTLRPRNAGGEAPRAAPDAPAPAPVATVQPEPMQTASLQPQPAAPSVQVAPSHDGYYVQISSQPSQDAAQASSRNLSQRYSSVIAGRNVVIQSADIPGKGTYYRVRVPVDSKSEGVSLCGDLKSAGGSCFVSR